MRLTIEQAEQILQNEIVWCLDNPDQTLTYEQRMGFMNGLRQAQILLRVAESLVEQGAHLTDAGV